MGTTFSSGNNVAIWCDKADYLSGNIVQGYVLLNVCEPIAATSLMVEVKGYERTSWEEITKHREYVRGPGPCSAFRGVSQGSNLQGPGKNTASQGHWREVEKRRLCFAKNEFLKVAVPLHHWDPSQQPLGRGHYQFPFRVALPASLPGSFRYDCDRCQEVDKVRRNVIGKVKYKVKACVLKNTEVLGLMDMATYLHGAQEIIVRQRLTRPPAELTAESVTDVRTCCCLRGHGAVVVRVRAARDAYIAGEAATMLLEIENHTDLLFKDVSLAVVRRVHLNASGSCHSVSDTIAKQNFPGLPKGTSYVGDAARRLVLPLPPSVVPTTLGSLVSCTYTAQVELSAGLLTNNARLVVPLTIYAAPPPHQAYGAAPPAFWRPQMIAPAVNVPLPMAGPVPAPYPAPNPVYAAPNLVYAAA